MTTDFVNACKFRALNFFDSSLITYFSNDYSFDKWIQKTINLFYDKGVLVILISSSRKSKNHLRTANFCKKNKNKLITFSGFSGNPLAKKENINFFLNSSNYNHIEMAHHFWLVLAVDFFRKKIF